MSYECATTKPAGLSPEEEARRSEAVATVAAALTRAKELGFLIHLAYNPQFFFLEPTVQKIGNAVKA